MTEGCFTSSCEHNLRSLVLEGSFIHKRSLSRFLLYICIMIPFRYIPFLKEGINISSHIFRFEISSYSTLFTTFSRRLMYDQLLKRKGNQVIILYPMTSCTSFTESMHMNYVCLFWKSAYRLVQRKRLSYDHLKLGNL